MANNGFIEEIKKHDFLMGDSILIFHELMKHYPEEIYTAMGTVYNSGILSCILAERYCDSYMLGTFIKKLTREYDITRTNAQEAVVEWVEVCSAIYGLSNKIDLLDFNALVFEGNYKPSYEFMPFLKLDRLYDYSYCIDRCKKGDYTTKDVGTIISILNEYLFNSQGLSLASALGNAHTGINGVNQNKKQTLSELEFGVNLLKKYELLYPLYLISMAQIHLLRCEFEMAISYYEDILNIKEISDPEDMDERYYCGELESASQIAHNIVSAYLLAGMTEKSSQAKSKYRKFFELQKKYKEHMMDTYCNGIDEQSNRMKEHYKKDIDDLYNNNSLVYFDLSLSRYYRGGDMLSAIFKDCERANKVYTDMEWSKIGVELTGAGELIVSDRESYENTIFMRLPKYDYSDETYVRKYDNNPLVRFNKVTSYNTSDFTKVFAEYFIPDVIKNIELGTVNVEEWDKNNKVVDESYGGITLSLGVDGPSGVYPVSYLEATSRPNGLKLFVDVEDFVRYEITLSHDVKLYINDNEYSIYITNSYDNTEGRNIVFYNDEDYRKAIAYLYIATLQQNFFKATSIDNNKKTSEGYLTNNKPIEATPHIPDKVDISTGIDSPYDRLNSLVGLDAIKTDVNNLVNLMKMQIRRQQQGLKPVPVSLHLVFSGNPGTGKTTIARILADIYKEIGILSKGHLVEVDRSGLVAGYVGQTAIKTQEKINESLGGILFIDEAYTLAKEGNDYGQEAIDTILKAMEDHRNDFIVIVAGYSDLMHKFINSNPGLKSRFNKYINFPDYTADEMIEIFMTMCNEYAFELTDDAKDTMETKIRSLEANKGDNFANARDVRNIFEGVITKQASRLAMTDTDDIMKIEAADFD